MLSGWSTAEARSFEPDFEPEQRLVEVNRASKKHIRQKKAVPLQIDWAAVERFYVEGEIGPDHERRWPTLKTICERFGCSEPALCTKSGRLGWRPKRLEWQYKYGTRGSYPERVRPGESDGIDNAVRDMADVVAKSNAAKIPNDDPLAVVGAFLSLFGQAVAEKRAIPFSVGDYERAVKLRTWLLNDQASKAERKEAVTLEQLQERHRVMRAHELALADEVAGVTALGETGGVPNETEAQPAPDEAVTLTEAVKAEAERDVEAEGRRRPGRPRHADRARPEPVEATAKVRRQARKDVRVGYRERLAAVLADLKADNHAKATG